MLRRHFVAGLATVPLFGAKEHITMSRISAITDEVAASPADAIAFAKQYGLRWLELRDVPGRRGHYMNLSEEELKQTMKELKDNGLRVSFFNTGYFKITLPGTDPVRRNNDTPESRAKRLEAHKVAYERRFDDLEKGIRAAHIMDVKLMRIFTFNRVAEPEKVFQQVADVLGEMGERARKQGITLVVENEGSCNVATSAELATFMKLLPEKSFGLNWDPFNGRSGETPFPDGYEMLPKKRILNVQIKGHSVLDEKLKLDWPAIFAALDRDGYKGQVGLETHYFDGTKIEKSHLTMRELQKMLHAS
jgi:sugar phosphate isomerase/epimerase